LLVVVLVVQRTPQSKKQSAKSAKIEHKKMPAKPREISFRVATGAAAVAAGLLIAACGSTQQYTTRVGSAHMGLSGALRPSPGKAKICVLRHRGFVGAGIAIDIADTGRPIGRIGAGRKLIWERDPGTTVIGASASNEQNITLDAKAGEVYFIEARTNWGAGFNTAACEIRLMPTEEGIQMLRELER
jgi:hypothetical protein